MSQTQRRVTYQFSENKKSSSKNDLSPKQHRECLNNYKKSLRNKCALAIFARLLDLKDKRKVMKNDRKFSVKLEMMVEAIETFEEVFENVILLAENVEHDLRTIESMTKQMGGELRISLSDNEDYEQQNEEIKIVEETGLLNASPKPTWLSPFVFAPPPTSTTASSIKNTNILGAKSSKSKDDCNIKPPKMAQIYSTAKQMKEDGLLSVSDSVFC